MRKASRRRNENEAAKRIYENIKAIDEFLRKAPVRRKKMAEELGISERTVQRYLKILGEAQGAIKRSKSGYQYANPEAFLTKDAPDEELRALLIASNALSQYEGTPIASHVGRVFRRIQDCARVKLSEREWQIASLCSFRGPAARRIDDKVWSRVIDGLLNKKRMRLHYQPGWLGAKTPKPMVVEPYHLANVDGDWYLLARPSTQDGIRSLLLAHIRMVYPMADGFKPMQFSPEPLLDNSFGQFICDSDMQTVKIRIDAKLAPLVRGRMWRPKAKCVEKRNGDIEISFQVSAAGPWPLFHVKQWVLSFGRYAQVVEPESMKKDIEDEIKAMVDPTKAELKELGLTRKK